MIRAVRPFETEETIAPDETAGFGALRTERGCLPLKSLDVRARICGLHARTVVRQTFHNSTDQAIEATYIFPLPDRAAVTSFTMRVADRTIEGLLRERQEAREEYDRAIASGHRASIAEEERSGTFSLRVGNLPPGEDIAIELTLVGSLAVAHGKAEYRFPLVVAPRYVPGVPLDGASVGLGVAVDTEQVPDASRVTPPVLLPGFANPVRLSLEVEFEPAGLLAGVDDLARSLTSSLHSVVVDEVEGLRLRLQPGERLNRDFILRFAVAASAVQTMLAYTAAEGSRPGTFALTIVPPAQVGQRLPQPRDVVFVIDRSGSMAGWKMVAARRAIGRLLDTLLEHDRFSVLAFDDKVEFSPETPRQLTPAVNRARWRTIEWLAKIDSRGGTEMTAALCEAVALVGASGADREPVIVLVTDGQVAGEDALLKALAATTRGRPPRVYAIGIDQAVNAGFLRRLADMGRGACELVESEDRLDEVMQHLHRLIGSPVLHDLSLKPVGWQWQTDSLAPAHLPDVFVDRPVTIFGRHNTPGELRLRVTGKDALGRPSQQEVLGRAAAGGLLTSLWGRARVRELEDAYASQSAADAPQLAQQIVAVSLEAHVLSRFTAYVAVDRSAVVNAQGKPREIVQPVELPEGWEEADAMLCEADVFSLCSTEILGAPSAPMPCMAPPRSKRKSASRRVMAMSVPTPPTDFVQAVERVATALAALTSGRWFSSRWKRLSALLESLEALIARMRSDGQALLPDAEVVLERCRELLVDTGAARDEWHAAVDQLAAEVQAFVDSLRSAPEGARAEFWK